MHQKPIIVAFTDLEIAAEMTPMQLDNYLVTILFTSLCVA